MTPNLLKILAEDRTPLVDALLRKLEQSDGVVEELLSKVRAQQEIIDLLRDEIARLKGSNKRPKFKASKKDKAPKTESASENEKRPGSDKVSKKSSLKIHETVVVTPEGLPEGSKLKRRRQFDVQDLIVLPRNTRYILEEWESPDGQTHSAQMPPGISQGHFGNSLCSFILNQHHQCQVTQPLLHEQLVEFGVDISTGQLNNILIEDQDLFHSEKDAILRAGLSVSKYVQTDDTGARHAGKNGYCTQIGNELFAWFHSSHSKSRINFLSILNSAYGSAYQLNDDAIRYMEHEGLPKRSLEVLRHSIIKSFKTSEDWTAWLKNSLIIKPRHIRIATEAALLGHALAAGLNRDLIVLSDDAGQFNIPLLTHALCWIHEERHLKNLLPGSHTEKAADLERAREDLWTLYRQLQEYRKAPNTALSEQVELAFDELFQRRTSFELLNQALKKIHAKKSELLVVLKEPAVPLHNNGSEGDIREYVKRRKVSGGTRSASGQRCRDTFASLKKTCRKLGVSFYTYLQDRLNGTNRIESLASLITKAAMKNIESLPLSQSNGVQQIA